MCDVERYTEYRQQTCSRGGSKTKNVQNTHSHLGTVSPLTSVYEKLTTDRNNRGDFQITGITVPLDRSLSYSVSTSAIISVPENPCTIWCAIKKKRGEKLGRS